MDWTKVKKEHIEQAIRKFIEERPEYPEPKSYYLLYEGEKLPSKYIRGMAYTMATGEKFVLEEFNGGEETVRFFAKYGYTVINETDKKRYSVNDSVWIAAAVMSYEKYNVDNSREIDDYAFVQSDIRERAEKINGASVEAARTSQWVCGDHENNNYSYLRAIGSKRRLTFPGEFKGDKEQPKFSDLTDTVTTTLGEITIQQLLDFVHKEYIEMNSQILVEEDIDYLGILKYLEQNRELPYKDPKKPELTEEEREKYLAIKANGQNVVAELKKIHSLCSKKFGLDKCEKIAWDDGSHTKTKGYLWAQMKYMKYEACQESISLNVELKDENTSRYRVSLEIKDDKADDNDIQNYHKHLELSLNEDARLIYVAGSNEWGSPNKLDEPKDVIIDKVKNKKYRKVQICRCIDKTEFTTNEEIQKAIFEAIEALLPYYEHVLNVKEKINNMESFNNGSNNVEFDKNIILYGPPGTGKTYHSAIYAVAICDEIDPKKLNNYDSVMARYEELKAEGRIAFTTFHQSYGYEEFIEGIRPVMNEEDTEVGYSIESGVFKRFCELDDKEDENATRNRVFVIDEINRGNISKIFGELITLIEETKRNGMVEAASAILPYSRKSFSVPNNVYILGTMNTADRSIQLMDTALRRRFSFIEMMPESDVLKQMGIGNINFDGTVLNVAAMLDAMNDRIAFLYDREHTIGHAFFTGLKANPTIGKLASIFEKSVIPLLQEYFYEDYQKIQLVLGDNAKTDINTKFILDKKVELKTLFMGSVEDVVDEKEVKYEINPAAFRNIQSYKGIANGL